MDPFKRHGIFKDTMIDSLHKMEANQDVLMAALSGNFESRISEKTVFSFDKYF